MNLTEFQRVIDATYGDKDRTRGIAPTFMWFTEEVGELARAIKKNDRDNLVEEFSDCLAWLTTLASLCDLDMAEVARRYAEGCPKCRAIPCRCGESNRFVEDSDTP